MYRIHFKKDDPWQQNLSEPLTGKEHFEQHTHFPSTRLIVDPYFVTRLLIFWGIFHRILV